MKVINLHWIHKDGKYLLVDESAKDDVIINYSYTTDGKDYKEEEEQKTHFFLCPPIPGPHKKLRILKGTLRFSEGYGNLRIYGKNIKSNKNVIEHLFVSTKSDYDRYEAIAFDSLDEVNEYLNKREDKGDLFNKL